MYLKQGINPCFIVQISNKDKAERELKIIKKLLNTKSLKWVCFVDKERDYETNTRLDKVKNKTLWQGYVKDNASFIDVVIFKMVITEGFDIPRACMLYQVRDSKSSSLDKQVIGRVRRNPALGYFEKLDSSTQEVFSKAYIYGIKPKENNKKKVELKGKKQVYTPERPEFESNEIIKEFDPFYATTYKEVPKEDIDIQSCIAPLQDYGFKKSIFQAYKEIQKCDDKVREEYADYVREFSDFYSFSANLDSIKDRVKSLVEDYDRYLKFEKVKIREDVYSFCEVIKDKDNLNIENDKWIWESENNEFWLDSQAEKEWYHILKNLAKTYAKSIEINGYRIYLFGKNFINKSNIKYEYYDERKRVSYPDFIFKDRKERIHIFEVKSVNMSKSQGIEKEAYEQKIQRLKQAYLSASKITGYIFYLPVKVGEDWQIWRAKNGEILKDMNKAMFEEKFKDAFEKDEKAYYKPN